MPDFHSKNNIKQLSSKLRLPLVKYSITYYTKVKKFWQVIKMILYKYIDL